MRTRKSRYFLSRVVKINLTQEDLMDAICNPAIIKVRNHKWTITNIIDGRGDEKIGPFIYGNLTKYIDESVSIVNENQHELNQLLISDRAKASSPFVYIPEFSGLCFLHVFNEIQSDVFPRRFKKIIEDSRNLKFHDLLIQCEVDAISDYSKFIKKLSKIKKIFEINAKVSPPNPLFSPLWAPLKEFLKDRRASTLKINEESEDKNGLNTDLKKIIEHVNENKIKDLNINVRLTDAAILMAADGYGKGEVIGEDTNQEYIEIKTEDSQKSFLFDKNPLPENLVLRARSEFEKISIEREMEH